MDRVPAGRLSLARSRRSEETIRRLDPRAPRRKTRHSARRRSPGSLSRGGHRCRGLRCARCRCGPAHRLRSRHCWRQEPPKSEVRRVVTGWAHRRIGPRPPSARAGRGDGHVGQRLWHPCTSRPDHGGGVHAVTRPSPPAGWLDLGLISNGGGMREDIGDNPVDAWLVGYPASNQSSLHGLPGSPPSPGRAPLLRGSIVRRQPRRSGSTFYQGVLDDHGAIGLFVAGSRTPTHTSQLAS